MGKAVIRTPALLLGFRRSRHAAGLNGGVAFNADFGPNHRIGSHECGGKNRTAGQGKTAPGGGFAPPEVSVGPGEGKRSVRKEMEDIPAANPFIGRAVADSALNFCRLDAVIRHAKELILADLPNDLTKVVYLASLRDCNTGHYFHPQISRQNDSTSASHALRLCHEEVFARLMVMPLSEYVTQLGGYICYARADEARVIDTWKSLAAYRATVPLQASALDAEFFFGSVEAALVVLQARRLDNL